MTTARKVGISALAVLIFAGSALVAYAISLPHLYDCTEFDYSSGASCTSGTVTLTGGSSQIISGLNAPADPNLKNGGSDVFISFTASGSGSGKAFLMGYPSQTQGTFITFNNGANDLQLPQPATGDTNVGLVLYANSSFSGNLDSICVDIVDPPVCSTPPAPDTSATTTIDTLPSTIFYGYIILMSGIILPIWYALMVDRRFS